MNKRKRLKRRKRQELDTPRSVERLWAEEEKRWAKEMATVLDDVAQEPEGETTSGTRNDEYVEENFSRLPWWASGRVIEDRVGRFQDGGEADGSHWMVPESMSVRMLGKDGKGHAGKVRDLPFDTFESSTIRKVIEVWGR